MNQLELITFIQSYWPLSGVRIVLLQNKGGRLVYKIEAAEGNYVIKISNAGKDEKEIKQDLYILKHGHEQGFTNIPKTLKTNSQNIVVAYEDRYAFIMEFIEGGTPEDRPDNWKRIALLTSRLHDFNECPFKTNFSVDAEKGWILTNSKKLSFGDEYKQLFDELVDLSDFPQTFIHTDIGLHNTAKNKAGEIYFLDWDGAGIGSRILDIGFPLISQFMTEDKIKVENLKAFYGTYFEHTKIPVTRKERAAIFDASLFFSLIYLPYMDVDKAWKKINFALDNKDDLIEMIGA